MDQPAEGNHGTVSHLTPVGTVQLEKFRFRAGLRLCRWGHLGEEFERAPTCRALDPCIQ